MSFPLRNLSYGDAGAGASHRTVELVMVTSTSRWELFELFCRDLRAQRARGQWNVIVGRVGWVFTKLSDDQHNSPMFDGLRVTDPKVFLAVSHTHQHLLFWVCASTYHVSIVQARDVVQPMIAVCRGSRTWITFVFIDFFYKQCMSCSTGLNAHGVCLVVELAPLGWHTNDHVKYKINICDFGRHTNVHINTRKCFTISADRIHMNCFLIATVDNLTGPILMNCFLIATVGNLTGRILMNCFPIATVSISSSVYIYTSSAHSLHIYTSSAHIRCQQMWGKIRNASDSFTIHIHTFGSYQVSTNLR